MNSRILLVCPEPLSEAKPAGVGIRFIEFARAIVEDGHEVTVLSADGGSVAGCASAKLDPASIRRFSSSSDVAIVQGHSINDFIAHAAAIPLVVDLYDPWIVENFHYRDERGLEVFEHDHATLLASVRQGDFFLCASNAQRLFYLGFFLAAGRLNPDVFAADPSLISLIDVVPFGVQPPRITAAGPVGHRLIFGGIYDWYEPLLAIEATRLARHHVPDLTLSFTRHPNPEIPQSAASEAARFVAQNALDFVSFDPWVAYEERARYYENYVLALLTFAPSLETDLSMRTRVFDFLWAGIPVISSSAPGTDEIIERYGAGSIVRSNDPAHFAEVIETILADPDELRRMRAGALAWAAQHPWSTTVQPLLRFIRSPRSDQHGSSPRGSAGALSPIRRSGLKKFYDKLGGRL
ncbi:MAG: glycosyltransferase family 4 protein [Acidobacteriota bacterium]